MGISETECMISRFSCEVFNKGRVYKRDNKDYLAYVVRTYTPKVKVKVYDNSMKVVGDTNKFRTYEDSGRVYGLYKKASYDLKIVNNEICIITSL